MVVTSFPIRSHDESGEAEDASATSNGATTFGRALRKEFLLDEDYVNLNHGSFGTYPRRIREVMRSFQDQAEARPDEFIRYEYPKRLDESRAAMARFLDVPMDTITFVPNATTGVNTVLRNLVYEPGDVIVYFKAIYGSCEKTIQYITETTAAEAARVECTYPVSDSALVSAFQATVRTQRDAGKRPVIALFETVVSMPGVLFPFAALTASCRALGLHSCIDAAHGVGHVPLDLAVLDPDFFVSNCHKWLLVPRGCAVFYVPVRNQHLLRSTLPTSHGFQPRPQPGGPKPQVSLLPASDKTPYVTNFEFVGTLDTSPYLCVPAALAYRAERLSGEGRIMAYCEALARIAGQRTADLFGTEVMENEERSLGRCFFAMVRLPISREKVVELVGGEDAFEQSLAASKVRDGITAAFLREHSTFVQLAYYADAWWVRLSAAVYLAPDDFEQAAVLLAPLCRKAESGGFL